eukprot:2676189-Pyramimonas_sp.AAC.1
MAAARRHGPPRLPPRAAARAVPGASAVVSRALSERGLDPAPRWLRAGDRRERHLGRCSHMLQGLSLLGDA